MGRQRGDITQTLWLNGGDVVYGLSCYDVKETRPRRGRYHVERRIASEDIENWHVAWVGDDVMTLGYKQWVRTGEVWFEYMWNATADVAVLVQPPNEMGDKAAVARRIANDLGHGMREIDEFLDGIDLEAFQLPDLALEAFDIEIGG